MHRSNASASFLFHVPINASSLFTNLGLSAANLVANLVPNLVDRLPLHCFGLSVVPPFI